MVKKLVGDFFDGGGHGVAGVDGTDNHGPIPAALVILHAGRLVVGHYGEVLPDLAFQAVLRELLAEDGIALAQSLQTVACDGSGAAHSEARAGEGLAEYHVVGQAEFLADHTHFILEEKLDGLYQLEFQVFRQAAHIVMTLHGAGLHDVGVDGALCQETDAVQLAGLLFENTDELCAYYLALLLRISYAGKLVEETVHRIYINQIRAEFVAENANHLLGLSLAQKAVVDVHRNQLLAHRLDEQRSNYR